MLPLLPGENRPVRLSHCARERSGGHMGVAQDARRVALAPRSSPADRLSTPGKGHLDGKTERRAKGKRQGIVIERP